MSTDKMIAKQYRDRVNQAVSQFGDVAMLPKQGLPEQGWLRTVRSALGMTGTQLAKKLGVTKARVFKAEQDEPHGSVTLKSMQAMAAAMDCNFVYAIVPKQRVENVIKQRAIKKAREQVNAASMPMTLAGQSVSKEQHGYEVERIAAQIIAKMPADLWSED